MKKGLKFLCSLVRKSMSAKDSQCFFQGDHQGTDRSWEVCTENLPATQTPFKIWAEGSHGKTNGSGKAGESNILWPIQYMRFGQMDPGKKSIEEVLLGGANRKSKFQPNGS